MKTFYEEGEDERIFASNYSAFGGCFKLICVLFITIVLIAVLAWSASAQSGNIKPIN